MNSPQDLGPTSVREALLLTALSDAGEILTQLEAMHKSVNQSADKVGELIPALQNAASDYQRAAQLLGAEAKNEVAAFIKKSSEKTVSDQGQIVRGLARDAVKTELNDVVQGIARSSKITMVAAIAAAALSFIGAIAGLAAFLGR